MKSGCLGSIVLAVVLIGALVFTLMCTERIPAGYAGVVYNVNGGITEETLSQGWHIVSPTVKVSPYTIGMEQSCMTADDRGDSKRDESFLLPTSDGKNVRVELEFSYCFDVERLPHTFTLFKGRPGDEIKETFIKPKVKAWAQEVSSPYSVADVIGEKRMEINTRLDEHLKEKFLPYGILIDTVNIISITVDEETLAAISEKVNAQQRQERTEIEAKTAAIEAERDKELARIKAEQRTIEATADADVVRIQAEAEADANKKIAESLTPELVEKIKYEKWDGKLPVVTGGETPILSMDNLSSME